MIAEKIGVWAATIIVPIVFVAVVIGVIVLVVLTGIDLVPKKLPETEDPDFLDNIFASRSVIFAIRAALIMAAGYVIISMLALIYRGRWLTEAGPFKTAEPVAEIDESAQVAFDMLDQQLDANATLEERLQERDQQLEAMWRDLQDAQQELDSLRRQADT